MSKIYITVLFSAWLHILRPTLNSRVPIGSCIDCEIHSRPRCLPECAHDTRGDMSHSIVGQLGKTEICNLSCQEMKSIFSHTNEWRTCAAYLCLEGVIQENVGRLDIPMYDPRMAWKRAMKHVNWIIIAPCRLTEECTKCHLQSSCK
jgi:hypothetical protein